jgi:predicted nucleic-acid-binding Zn-ribbon protein
MQTSSCPKCDGTMQRGHLVGVGNDGTYTRPYWAPGETEKSFWTGIKVDKDELRPLVTLRCTKCGFLETYAPLM